MTGGITNPEVVINIAHEHGFIILRPLQVGRSLLRIRSVLPLKPLFVAYNDFLFTVPLKEADEELDHPKGSFPKGHHYKHLWGQWQSRGKYLRIRPGSVSKCLLLPHKHIL